MAATPEVRAELQSLIDRHGVVAVLNALVALVGTREVERKLADAPRKKPGRPLSVTEAELRQLGQTVSARRGRLARYPDAISMLGPMLRKQRHTKAQTLVRNFNRNPEAYLPKRPPVTLPEIVGRLRAAGRDAQAGIDALRRVGDVVEQARLADVLRDLADRMRPLAYLFPPSQNPGPNFVRDTGQDETK